MRKILFSLLFMPLFLCGQTRYTSRFVTGKVLNVTQIAGTASTFDVSVQFLDETGLFTGDNVQVGDYLYMNDGVHGIAFPITAILSPGAIDLTIRVENTIGVASIPTGTGVVTRGTPNFQFLPYVSGGFQENQVLLEDFIYRADSLLLEASGVQAISRDTANLVTLSDGGGTVSVADRWISKIAPITPGSTSATVSGTLPADNSDLFLYRNLLLYTVGNAGCTGCNAIRSGNTFTFSRAFVPGETIILKHQKI